MIVAASYKWLCSSFGGAVMYVNPFISEEITPGLLGFRSHKNMWDCKADRVELKDTADKFEFSTMHFGSIYGLTECVKLINKIGIKKIFKYNMSLSRRLRKHL